MLCCLAVLTAACGVLDDLPSIAEGDLEPQLLPQTSRLLDAEGRLLTTFHGSRNRTVVPIKRVPDHVQQAIVAIEDERFYQHEGVDVKAVVRALVHNITSGGADIQGGSTITQQYVKNRIIAPNGDKAPQTIERKIKEAALARQLEEELSKKRILERYLNTVYFGNGAYGIQAASKTYFGTPVKKLSLKQGALLAAVIKAPESFDPYDGPRRAKKRRNTVVRKMRQLDYVSGVRAEKVMSYPLGLRKEPKERRHDAPYFVDYVKRLLVHHPRFSFLGDSPAERSERLFRGGLRVHTTLDRGVQKAAEAAIDSILIEKRDPHASLVAMDPRDGHVLAMIGGRNFFSKARYSKLNLAISGKPNLGRSSSGRKAPGTGRQAGSAFKTFALAAAIAEGIPVAMRLRGPACDEFPDPNSDEPWKVCNYGRADYGRVTLRKATTSSINTAFARLILRVGPRKVTKMARHMGIRTDLLPVPSAVLGTNSVNPLDMATAYSTLANQGTKHRPVAITKITGPTGETLYEDEAKPRRVVDRGVAYITTSLLEQAIENGTGTAADLDRPAAGKTGTAQEYRDAWFAGSTPNLTAAVWVGYPRGSISMKTACGGQSRRRCIPTRIQVTGGSWPAQIWNRFMSTATRRLDLPARGFRIPNGALTRVTIDARTGCIAHDGAPDNARKRVVVPKSARPPRSGERCKVQRREDRQERRSDRRQESREKSDDDSDSEPDRDETSDEPEPEPDPLPTQEPDPEPSEEPDPDPSEEGPDPDPTEEPSPDPSEEPSPDPSG